MGDVMKFEVSVQQFHHAPLRVTVDSCTATVVPSIDTVPRYAFLGNRGSVVVLLVTSLVYKPLTVQWS